MKKIKKKDHHILVKWIDQFIDKFLETRPQQIIDYVEELRKQNKGITKIQLAQKISNKKSFQNGLIGAATGIGGFITSPITVPTDLIATWKIQITLAYTIAYVFGYTEDRENLKTDIYLILSGNYAEEIVEEFEDGTIKEKTTKVIENHLTREVMKKIWEIVPQKIITKVGQKSFSNFMKIIPFAGAPAGFIFDYFGTRVVGSFAIKYYNKK